MAATLIAETEIMDCTCLSVLIFGPPGAWKTSIAQTAEDPITLDFDKGAHRSFNRRAVMRFGCWADVADAGAEIAKRKTVVVDTVGRLLDMLAQDIVAANPKHGSAHAGLSLQGFGALKSRFAAWVNQLRLAGKDLIFIAHEKEEKDGDDRLMRPDITGGSYTEVMKFTDLVGYLGMDRQGKRTLDFNPSDRHAGKNAAGWPPLPVPNLAENKLFFAGLLADAKKKIGHTAEASAAVARVVAVWESWLALSPELAAFNAKMPELSALKNGTKAQVWHLVQAHAEREKWTLPKGKKEWVAPQREVGEEDEEQQPTEAACAG